MKKFYTYERCIMATKSVEKMDMDMGHYFHVEILEKRHNIHVHVRYHMHAHGVTLDIQ